MKPGLLLSCFDYSPVAEDEFHDWYDTEHIPERERVPGFLRCKRWLSADGRKLAVATYDLQSVDILRSPDYLAIGYENNSPWTRRVGWRCLSLLRFEGELVMPERASVAGNAGALLVTGFNLTPDFETEFRERFMPEHIAGACEVAGVLSCQLFCATKSNRSHVVLYHLQDPRVVDRDKWQQSVEAPWLAQVRPHERDTMRALTRRYVRGDRSSTNEKRYA